MGNRPDCVHCRFLLRHDNGEYRCRQHNIILHSPISIFCKQISLLEGQNEAEQAWFKESIDPKRLNAATLYTWIETHIREGKKSIAKFDNEELGLLTAYITWSAGTFWAVLRSIRQVKLDSYRQHGYEIDE
jgi:hypothetical protein